jgi:uncharacterized membrane protein
MKVHLIKDSEVGKEVFSEVVDLLQAIDGPIEFFYDTKNTINFTEDDVVESQVLEQKSFEKLIRSEERIYANMRPSKSNEFEFRPFRNFSFPLFRKTTKWTTIFNKCTNYRNRNNIPDNESFYALLF